MQTPIGLEGNFAGVIDLISMKAFYFEEPFGETIKVESIPPSLVNEAMEKREELLDAAAMFSDELTEAILEDSVTEDLIHEAIRKGTIARELTPVLLAQLIKYRRSTVIRWYYTLYAIANRCREYSLGHRPGRK